MSQQATNEEMHKFVRVVDEFMQNYARLASPDTRAAVYASNDPKLLADYQTALSRGSLLKNNIEAVTGAWKAAKAYYENVTQTTSMVIGDAIDEIRSWFGYNPGGVNGLGAVQIPAAFWVAGVVSAALLLNSMMKKIFVSVEASRIQRENPGMAREVAYARAESQVGFSLFGGGIKRVAVLGALGVLVYMVVTR